MYKLDSKIKCAFTLVRDCGPVIQECKQKKNPNPISAKQMAMNPIQITVFCPWKLAEQE